MIEGIKPLHDESLNCILDLVWSLSSWWGRNYELMFVEAWDFPFVMPDANASRTMGERFIMDPLKFYKSLEHYHGINADWTNFDIPSPTIPVILPIVKRELAEGRPVAIGINSFYCPWDIGYQQHHSIHFFLAIGLDETNMYCVDGFYNKQSIPISMEELTQGCLGCVTFAITHDELKDIDWKNILESIVTRLQDANGGNNAFMAMERFNDEMLTSMDLNTEAQGEEFFWNTPLIRKLLEISRGRRQLAKTLQFIANRYNVTPLTGISQRMEKAGWRWDTVRSLLMKASMMPNPTPPLCKAAEKIREAVADEIEIAQELLQASKYDPKTLIATGTAAKMEVRGTDGKEILVDLTSYFNNKGFGNLSEACAADLIGNGSYFVADSLTAERLWQFEGMKFSFPQVADDLKDNISCAGQNIPIPPGRYCKIMAMGCAEWENYSDRIVIAYENGETEEVPLEFTDWSFQPVFGETTAWSGHGARRKDGKVKLLTHSVQLYAKSYNLKCNGSVTSIRLPDCPNLHVFAISFLAE